MLSHLVCTHNEMLSQLVCAHMYAGPLAAGTCTLRKPEPKLRILTSDLSAPLGAPNKNKTFCHKFCGSGTQWSSCLGAFVFGCKMRVFGGWNVLVWGALCAVPALCTSFGPAALCAIPHKTRNMFLCSVWSMSRSQIALFVGVCLFVFAFSFHQIGQMPLFVALIIHILILLLLIHVLEPFHH